VFLSVRRRHAALWVKEEWMRGYLTTLKSISKFLFVVLAAMALTSLLICLLTITNPWTVDVVTAQAPARATPGSGFILHFDTTLAQFEVITLPTLANTARRPHDLLPSPSGEASSGPAGDEIWYTDPVADKIGHLVYTATNDYTITEFNLPQGSEPFEIAEYNGYLWFTARRGDWIGRLEISTTNIVSFALTANSQPWSIDIGSDGSIWFTEKQANQLGRLIVTDTNDFDLIEYPISQAGSQPDGLLVVPLSAPNPDVVFFTITAPPDQNRLGLLDLASNSLILTDPLPAPSYPVNLAIANANNDLWFTELSGNRLSFVSFGTFTIPRGYVVPTAGSQPYDLAVDPNGVVWFTERAGRNMGRLSLEMTMAQFTEYAVPSQLGPIWLQGIALDSQDNLWLAAFTPQAIYLPAILKGS